MRRRLLVLSRQGEGSLPEGAVSSLERLAEVHAVARRAAPDPDEAARLLADVDVLAATNVCLPRLDRALLDATPRLTGVVLYATGYDHLDLALLRRRGVTVSVLPQYATFAVAEHCVAMMLALATRLHLAQDRSRGWVPPAVSLRGVELAGRTLGVVGAGRIGSRVIELAKGLGMRVVAHDIDPVVQVEVLAAGTLVVEIDELLAGSDVVALCADAHHRPLPVLEAREIRRLRPHAFVVNIGRPQLVDTAAALAAIRAGRLRGYAVDEIVADPRRDKDVIDEGRLLQTGHSAWWRDEVLTRGRQQWYEHIVAMLRGTPLDVATIDEDAPGELTEAAT